MGLGFGAGGTYSLKATQRVGRQRVGDAVEGARAQHRGALDGLAAVNLVVPLALGLLLDVVGEALEGVLPLRALAVQPLVKLVAEVAKVGRRPAGDKRRGAAGGAGRSGQDAGQEGGEEDEDGRELHLEFFSKWLSWFGCFGRCWSEKAADGCCDGEDYARSKDWCCVCVLID
jgi:hypothetical protein